jgi:hypothetical protein
VTSAKPPGPLVQSRTIILDSQKIAHAVMAPVRWWYIGVSQMLKNGGTNWQIEKQLNGLRKFYTRLHTLTLVLLLGFIESLYLKFFFN